MGSLLNTTPGTTTTPTASKQNNQQNALQQQLAGYGGLANTLSNTGYFGSSPLMPVGGYSSGYTGQTPFDITTSNGALNINNPTAMYYYGQQYGTPALEQAMMGTGFSPTQLQTLLSSLGTSGQTGGSAIGGYI